MALTIGSRLGVFEVTGVLGAGGMGEVYRARDTGLKRDVALKILPAALAADADRVARFQREAEVLATLAHPHIAAIHGLVEADGVRALVLEFVPGETLADRVARGPVPVDETLALARQLADALDYAHEHSVVHRDLKPANLKVTPDGTLKVLDFGLAKALEGPHPFSAGAAFRWHREGFWKATGPAPAASPAVRCGPMAPTLRHISVLAALGLALTTAAPFARQAAAPRVVDDALLTNPPAEEWLGNGRDYAETHHSPLARIDQSNVSRLARAWEVEVGSQGKIETTPIISNGVLYGTSTWSVVYAVDARTGALKWRWDPALVKGGYNEGGSRFCCGPVNRGVAVYKGRVYVGLLDGRLVALDALTGHVAWAVQTTPTGADYSITGAPRIVKGKVLIGNGGGEYGVRGYVTAYEADSGKQAWRWWVVPGDPSKGLEDRSMEMALKTWKGEWWKYGGGGTPWDGLAYDPEATLVYVGTGNGSPWARDHRSPGGGDNLYLSSIVAINADTGRYVWHYQTTPGDDWDYNAAQHMILADLTIGGRPRKVLLQAPKNGFFYVIDRLTGELLSAQPYVTVTWATHIDLKTGRPVETPEARYGAKGSQLAPSAIGAHHWPPMAFNPKEGLVYFPGQETSMVYKNAATFDFKEGQWNTGTAMGAAGAAIAAATATPGRKGFFVAWDPAANKERWRIPFNPSGGALSTAGQLVFVGDNAGTFMALDPATGKELWQHKLMAGIATPVTYELDGKQYVAVMSGVAGGKVFAFTLDGK